MSVVRKTTVVGKRGNRGKKGRDLPLLTSNALHLSLPSMISAKLQGISQVYIQPDKLIKIRTGTKQRLKKNPFQLMLLTSGLGVFVLQCLNTYFTSL